MNDTSLTDNPRARIGGNYPPEEATPATAPTPIEYANAAFKLASDAAERFPAVVTKADAAALKPHIDALRSHEKELDETRDGLVRPLNQQVADINGIYKPLIGKLRHLRDVLSDRVGAWMAAEEERLEAEARAAAARAEEARQAALEAEAREREAIDNAAAGECTDVGGAVEEADAAFHDAKLAEREAARAQRDAKVKVSGGFGRSLGLRSAETLTVDDPVKAIRTLMKAADGQLDEKIAAAIITAARAYRKTKGALPAGVTSSKERAL